MTTKEEKKEKFNISLHFYNFTVREMNILYQFSHSFQTVLQIVRQRNVLPAVDYNAVNKHPISTYVGLYLTELDLYSLCKLEQL